MHNKDQRFYGYKHWTLEDTPRCFYVGKGLQRRPFSTSRTHRSRKWHAIVKRFGFRVEICVGPITNEEACAWEIESIVQENTYSMNYSHNGIDIACNFTKGGEGAPGRVVSISARQRIGDAQRSKPKSQETKDKLRAALIGRGLPSTTRQRMSDAKRGKPLTKENRRNLWKNRSHKFTEEHRKNLSLAASNRRASPETREKMSKALKGKRHRCSQCGELGHLRPNCKQ